MPAGGAPGVPAPAACCDWGRIDPRHPVGPQPHTYVDGFGFANNLCDLHYGALVTFLLRHEGLRGSGRAQRRPGPVRGILPRRHR